MTTTLIVGCGYLGKRVAETLLKSGQSVRIISRHRMSKSSLDTSGISPYVIDLDASDSHSPNLPSRYRLLYTVPPPDSGEIDPRVLRLHSLLDRNPPSHAVYISTTGVYGHHQGQWVNEDSLLRSSSPRSLRRLHAEQSFRDWCTKHRCSLTILRVAGIYGPGRMPIKRIESKVPVVDEQEASWSNRIHIEDLTRICTAALDKTGTIQLLNVSDDRPTSTTSFINAVADAYHLKRPSTVSLSTALENATPRQYSYLTESRRIDNKRVKKSLNISLLYPDFFSYFEAQKRDL